MVVLAVLLYCLVPSGCPIGHIVYLWTLTVEITGFCVAEKEGFEPSRPFRSLHDFQSCALDQLGDFSIAVSSTFR